MWSRLCNTYGPFILWYINEYLKQWTLKRWLREKIKPSYIRPLIYSNLQRFMVLKHRVSARYEIQLGSERLKGIPKDVLNCRRTRTVVIKNGKNLAKSLSHQYVVQLSGESREQKIHQKDIIMFGWILLYLDRRLLFYNNSFCICFWFVYW